MKEKHQTTLNTHSEIDRHYRWSSRVTPTSSNSNNNSSELNFSKKKMESGFMHGMFCVTID